MSEAKEQETHTSRIEADTPSGRFFAPVQETVHLSGLSWERRRWELHNLELREEYRLVVSTADDVWEYPVRKEVIIGRSEDCHVILDVPGVKKHHLALNTDGSLFWFRCLGIGGEIKVDGQSTQEGWLKGGEELRVGDARIYFMVPDRMRDQARLPVPFESTEIKDHSRVLHAVRRERLSGADSCELLQQVDHVHEGTGDVEALQNTQERVAPQSSRINTRAWWAAIVVFCLGVTAILVAGGLHLRKRQKVRHKAAVAKRNAARKASLVAFQKANRQAQVKGQIQRARQAVAAKQWKQAVGLLTAALAHGVLSSDDTARARKLLVHAQGEQRAAETLDKAQALSLKDGHERQILDLLQQIPATSASATEARVLRHAVRKELRLQIKMCRVMLQGQKLAKARDLLRRWLKTVRSPQEAQQLELTQEHLEAQQMAARLGEGALSVFEPRDKPQKSAQSHNKPAARDAHSKDALEWLSLGRLAFRMGRIEKAMDSFTRAKAITLDAGIRSRAALLLQHAQHYRDGLKQGLRAVQRKQFRKAIPLLQQAIAANRYFGRVDPPRLSRALAHMVALRGLSRIKQKQFDQGYADLAMARKQLPRHDAVRRGWRQLEARAKELLVEANVLRSVAPDEYKRLLKRILGMTDASMASHRKARQLLRAAR